MFDWWGDGAKSVSGPQAAKELKAKLKLAADLGLFTNMSMPGGVMDPTGEKRADAFSVDDHIYRSIDPKDIAPPPKGF